MVLFLPFVERLGVLKIGFVELRMNIFEYILHQVANLKL